MSGQRDLSRNSCVVMIGVIGTCMTILLGGTALFSFVTGRDSLADFLRSPAEPTPPPRPTSPRDPEETVPTPITADFVLEPQVPSNACPEVSGIFWLQYPDIWYGPFFGGDALLLSSFGGFTVWDADMLNVYGTYGATIPYPDPFFQVPRNQWIPLNGSIFHVCIDSGGNVFGSDR